MNLDDLDKDKNKENKLENDLTFDFDYYDEEEQARQAKKVQKEAKKALKGTKKALKGVKQLNDSMVAFTLLLKIFFCVAVSVALIILAKALFIELPTGTVPPEVKTANVGADTEKNQVITNEQQIFNQVKDVAEQAGEMVKAALTDIGYLNQLATDNVGGFTYYADTEYDLIQAYNNSRKIFITNYNNSNIRVNRGVVAGVSPDGSYVSLGTVDTDGATQLILKMTDNEKCRFAKTLYNGDILTVEGTLDVDKKSITIEVDALNKIKPGQQVTYSTGKFLTDIFENGNMQLINNNTVELYGVVENLKTLDNDINLIELKVNEYNNTRLFAVVGEDSTPTFEGLSNSDSATGVKLRVTGTVSICDIDESSGQQFYIFINNSNIELR